MPYIYSNTRRPTYVQQMYIKIVSKTNREHGRMLKIGETSPSAVYPVQNGTFGKYREYKISKGTSQNQVKSIRVINSREQLDFLKKYIRVLKK